MLTPEEVDEIEKDTHEYEWLLIEDAEALIRDWREMKKMLEEQDKKAPVEVKT